MFSRFPKQLLWVFQETEEGHSTAWTLVVELHLWEALHNFPQAGFQSDHVLIQV